MARVVLASKSPRRHVLLGYLLADFDTHGMDVTEEAPRALSIEEGAEVIARKKALAGSRLFRDRWILAADTVVHQDGTLMDKANSAREARERLESLMDGEHHVTTALALAWFGRSVDDAAVTTRLRLDPIPEDVFDAYLHSELWLGKAGAYGIQDAALRPYLHILEGPWSNVVGLPMAETAALLARNRIPCKEPPTEEWLQEHNPFDGEAGSPA